MKKKDVLLELRSYMDEKEILYMKTKGKVWEKEGFTMIEWDNPDFAGGESNEKSIISVGGENTIMLFSGENAAKPSLYIEKGKRCVTQAVDTQYMNYIPVGNSVNFIKNSINTSGELRFSYTIDCYTAQNMTKMIDIKIIKGGSKKKKEQSRAGL